MEVTRILAEIDAQIEKLQKAREALVGIDGSASAPRGRGRPRKNAAVASDKPAGKRQLSPEGRKRIAEAMKRRWAERRKAAAK